LHTIDFSPGLANKLSFPFATYICLTFAEAKKFFKPRAQISSHRHPHPRILFTGDVVQGRALCGFTDAKPCLMIMGGGQGAEVINKTIRKLLPQLLPELNIIHICGTGKLANDLVGLSG